jgi:hypothetical protein
MRNSKARARALAITVGCVALMALVLAGAANAASRGYRLQNHSNHTLKLDKAEALPTFLCNGTICARTEHPMDFEGRPGNGSLLKPGGTDAWELKYVFGKTYAAELKYSIEGTSAIVTYTIETSTFSNDSACKVTPPSAGKCSAHGTSLAFNNG